MTNTCPECGASLPDGTTCQTIFDEFLVLEFTDPAYGAVHMLTVACFMIQHGRYSDEALAWIAAQLRASLEQGVPADQIRREAARRVDQTTRTWKVTRRADASALPKIPWSLTIADVATDYRDAASYCALIRAWATRTLAEMPPLLNRPR